MSAEPGLLPPYIGVVFVAVLGGAGAFGFWKWRGIKLRSEWNKAASELGGKVELDPNFGRMKVRGRYKEHAAFLQQGVSHEDAMPYPHTRGALNMKNPASVVMGLRHKSMLEEVATRKEERPVPTGDQDFDRSFFLVMNSPEHVETVLPAEIRRTLSRYSDVEIYLKSTQIEWRRSGTMRSAQDMLALFDVAAEIADALDKLPQRTLSLSQKMEEEALIEQGI